MDKNEIVKEHCNECLGVKNAEILYTETKDWKQVLDEEEGVYINGSDTWELLRCLGCDSVRMRHRHWFSEDWDEDGPIEHKDLYPPSVTRQKPIWRRRVLPLNEHLRSYDGLCDEIYNALTVGAHRLAAMGIRALVERLMIEQVQDQGSFENNIRKFFEEGHVAPRQQNIFRDTLIEAGHAAMHRNFEPTAEVVNTLLDIVEGIMHSIHYEPMLAEKVKGTIPTRKR